MKISKLSAAVGVFAFCVSFASVHAQDNPAQAAARETLMKQSSQGQAPAAPAALSAPVAPVAPAAPVAPVAPTAPAVAMTPKPAAAAVQPATPVPTDSIAQAAARAALIEKMNSPASQTPVAAPTAAPMTISKSAPSIPAATPIVAPDAPVSAAKQQRLQALLVQYKADQITPEQYQKQRAAILADP